ncbi:hypothetical protein QCB45_06010 [Thiomicrorhabdus sp. ZW0627]|uniref:hypothetical protein n=1 Tax=Thiomicrorhabdus sp. ZW0627 TaxID=3039774 RepID=UPI0024372748|nr:hypothetical protein [Thiomicrorhabdus sp. ZW0627]MDG6773879.1 hypothetical protein [Thiomicrorhabdus sp. ZW0627]
MKSIHFSTVFVGALSALFSAQILASNQLTLGAWYNYANENDNLPGNDYTKNGEFGDGAVILYADGAAEKGQGNWSYSAELRVGPGSFTDTANNSTGDEVSLHKAWIGFDFEDDYKLIIGKSQVPFGWKTSNFWPGDMFQAGYGDQMDVGLKLEARKGKLNYNLAYYLQDDWWATSTDTTDDNRHWGSSTTYRKVGTFVADLNMDVVPNHTVGVSLQAGKLEDLTAERSNVLDKLNSRHESDGDHSAAVLYYKGKFGPTFVNAEVIQTRRKMPSDLVAVDNIASKYETMRYAFEIGRSSGNWTYYLDATWADSATKGNDNGMVAAYAPGIRYDYGPGWIYAEYLTQNGYIDRYGDVVSDDYKFSAVYLSMDWYY